MTMDELTRVVQRMNEAAQLASHNAEYVVMAAQMAYVEGERQGRVNALEEAKKIVEAAA